MGNRLRLLLLFLTIAFIGTALTINLTVDDKDILTLDSQKLSENIHKKEKNIHALFADSIAMQVFQNADKYPLQASQISDKLLKKGIYIFIYNNHKPIQWSSNVYVPLTDLGLKEGTSFIRTENRSFLVQKKQLKNDISVVAGVPIKRNFQSNNEYLQSIFSPQILKTNNLDIASYNDTNNIQNIYSINGNYLFSVKLKSDKKESIYINLQILSWFLGIISLILLTNSICLKLARSGYAWQSIICFAILLLLYRVLDLNLNWFPSISNSLMFDAKYYAYNQVLPNLWAFFISSISLFWLICYIHSIRKILTIPHILLRRRYSYCLSLVGLLSIYLLANVLYIHLGTLITTTSLIDDFTSVWEINKYSCLIVFLFCFNVTILLLFIDFIVFLSYLLIDNVNATFNIQLIALIISMIAIALFDKGIYFNILLSAIIMFRSIKRFKYRQLHLSAFILSLFIIALMSSIALAKSIHIKRENTMKQTLNTLDTEDDINAITLFHDLENSIVNDRHLRNLFFLTVPHTDGAVITQYIKNKYLQGYLSKFDFKGFYYYNEGIALDNYSENWMDYYREKVITNSTKIGETDYFYRLGSAVGTYEYFAKIDIPMGAEESVHILLNFRNESYRPDLPYPEFMTDANLRILQSELYTKSGFAVYKNDQLITQSGQYTYPSSNTIFPKDINKYIRKDDKNGFYHLIYNPDENITFVVSQSELSVWEFAALFSIIFILLYLFLTLFNIINYILGTINEKSYRYRSIKYHFLILRNTIQYSTRIQTLVIGSVIIGIALSGLIAFVSISRQLENNKVESKFKNISAITSKLETHFLDYSIDSLDNIENILTTISSFTTQDYNLFDKSGKLVYTSQPRIYENKLLSKYINPHAYEKLNVLKKAEVIEKEVIGNFRYDASYATIHNRDYEAVAFISFPNFSSKREENSSNNLLLNTLLNIYTIVIILFGFLAVLVSNKITKPLSIIQRKLSQTTFSEEKPNEPLYWERNDEIGTVIKEYNYMLVKLEESTRKLKNAERESAWREMAKQVAHEIKNPLTPMKLGIQQLNRSYIENDPRFTERFQKVSQSFIEQIDSLSRIATEFSNFAKLPNTKLTKIDLLQKITKSIHVYNNSPIASLRLINLTGLKELYIYGDRDQVLRTFNNLIKNSIEAAITKKRHRITISVNLDEENKKAVIEIKDNGVGIPEDIIPKIFQPNFTTKSSGTGLGLAFVKKTIDSMNGEITFYTQRNIGTTFIIKVPLYQATKIS